MRPELFKTLITLFFLCLLVISLTARADVTANVDREYAYEGETVTLSIKASNVSVSGQPDFSPLSKDFELLGTSQGSSISIINGQRSDSQTWSIRLRPKTLGKITIPSIQLGQFSTLPLTVDIRPIPVQTGSQQNASIFITLEVDSQAKNFFVQQHIPLVARLYYIDDVTQGTFTDPTPDNATVERLGEDRKFTAPYNGKIYNVFERRYSILPEKSGDLVIPPVSFRGYLSKKQPAQNKGQRYDPFSRFFDQSPFSAASSPVSVRSEAVELAIKTQPDNYTGQQWLPAESVELTDSWTSQPPAFKVGEPVSRTIILTAKGLLASQVQSLELPDQPGFRRYAEPAETETRTDGQTVYAISRQTFTYIPAAAGMQEIPAVEVKWWDIINNRQASTVLPAWNVQVVADPNRPASPLNNDNAAVTDNAVSSNSKPSKLPLARTDQAATANSDSEADKITGALDPASAVEMIQQHPYWLAGLVLLIVILWLMRNRKKTFNQVRSNQTETSADKDTAQTNHRVKQQAINDLNQACQNNNARAVTLALLKLAEISWPESPPRSLGALAEKVTEGKQALLDLDRVLYSPSDAAWDATEISRYFNKGFNNEKVSENPETVLKPLYPG